MRVVFLGVGEAFDRREANTSILVESDLIILLDCGYSTPHSLWNYEEDPNFIDVIYISHFHADHWFGIPPLLVRMWEEGRRKKLRIIGQRGIEGKVRSLMGMGYGNIRINYEVEFIEVYEKFELNGVNIRAARTEHSLDNLAIRIDFNGKSICYSGDGRLTDEVRKLFKGSNLAVCECYSIKPFVRTHSCLEDLMSLADQDGPELIALVHINRRERELLRRIVDEKRFIVPKQYDVVDL
ncbi:MAG: MBL fold metallo-hydrolase [Candidatus Methanodesulfokora sp.]